MAHHRSREHHAVLRLPRIGRDVVVRARRHVRRRNECISIMRASSAQGPLTTINVHSPDPLRERSASTCRRFHPDEVQRFDRGMEAARADVLAGEFDLLERTSDGAVQTQEVMTAFFR
jgi:hypothetical protein